MLHWCCGLLVPAAALQQQESQGTVTGKAMLVEDAPQGCRIWQGNDD
jgi:hypothetical protein